MIPATFSAYCLTHVERRNIFDITDKVDPNAVKNLLQTIDAERLFQRPPLLSMGKKLRRV